MVTRTDEESGCDQDKSESDRRGRKNEIKIQRGKLSDEMTST